MTVPHSAYASIMYAAMLHVIEALILACSISADGSIGIATLLAASPSRALLIAVMLIAAGGAGVVLAKPTLSPLFTIIVLAPQQALLFTTSIGAWLAVWNGSYADHVLRSPLFITADQLPRGMFSLIHLSAIYALALYRSRSRLN